MPVTIKDIAQKANVSYSTVSKALNDSPLVKEKTKEKIIKFAKEMGYEPNFAAQQLVSKQSKVIGLIWPTIERMALSSLLTKINNEISMNSYSMILSINPIKSSLEMFKRFQVDGVIVFDEHENISEIIDPFSSSFPILSYGVGTDNSFPVLDVNRQVAMEMAVEYLYNLGHRKIAFIGDFSPIDDRQMEKYYGFKKAMKKFNLPLNSQNLVNAVGLDWYDGYTATNRLLDSSFSPTAILGSSYEISAGIVRALRESNYIIPKDISVISYDNIPQMANIEIPLTSVGVKPEIIAHDMVKLLLSSIKEKDHAPLVHLLTPTISERNSCAQAILKV